MKHSFNSFQLKVDDYQLPLASSGTGLWKSICFTIVFTCLSLWLSAQSSTQNYIVASVPYTPLTDVTSLTSSNSNITIQYFDGLGRPIETVQKAISGITGSDLVSLTEYDGVGRDYKRWLPITSTGSGAYVAPATITANTTTLYDSDDKPYATTNYEPSPLNRVTGKYGPGASWYADKRNDNISYGTNSDDVNYYYIENNLLKNSGKYRAKELFSTIMYSEDHKMKYEFKDKQGHVILIRNIDGHDIIDTHYVYNDLGQLCYVLPPMAVDQMSSYSSSYNDNNEVLKKYCYLYKYDERGNNVVKRLPGCDSICMVYDKADRMVLSQDGNQRAKLVKQWTVTKYDALGRVVYTGLINRSNTRTDLATEIKDLIITEQYDSINSTFNNTGYTCNYFKDQVTPIEVIYYDNYNFIKKNSLALAFSKNVSGYTTYYPNSKGLLTGTRTYILDKNMTSYTATALYYDDKGCIVQNRSTNFLGGYDNLYSAYDFTGKILNTYKEHSISNFTNYPERYSYTYDQAGRLLDTNHQYGALLWVKLSSNKYDELGRLVTTYRHNGTDSIKYEYNIRNWLTKLKSGPLFEENVYYNTNPLSTNPCYNGNISYSTWTYNGVSKGYAYTYDELNRLKDANFKQGTSTQTNGAFDESFTYDKMGNILTLQRKKDQLTIDNLSLNYSGNQLTYVTDGAGSRNLYNVKEYQNKSTATSNEFAYDKNGNMIKDLDRDIVTIRYNLLNLPDTIQFKTGNVIINHYDAMGQKLQSDYYTGSLTITPIAEGQVTNPENGYSQVYYGYAGKANIGNVEYYIYKPKPAGVDEVGWVYTNSFSLDKMYNTEGYLDRILFPTNNIGVPYNYYRKDHLGNNREVWTAVRQNAYGVVKSLATTRQRTQYYPSGLPWASNSFDYPSAQSHKYNGKEFIEMHGLDTYDYGARGYYPAMGSLPTVDPLAEKHYNISPYVYCAGNPVNLIDPDGMDWYKDKDGTNQYNPDLNKDNQKDILGKGQSYVGETYQVKDKDGNVTTNYRKDGSIMFGNETTAYNRMWNQANKVNREQFAVIRDKSVLVLPDYKNDNTTSEVEAYGYSFKDSKLIDPVTNSSFSTLATIHTHQDGLNGEWGFIAPPGFDDNKYFPNKTPNVPYFTMAYDHNLYGNVGNRNGYHNIELPNGYNKVNNLLGGAKLQLLLRINTNKK